MVAVAPPAVSADPPGPTPADPRSEGYTDSVHPSDRPEGCRQYGPPSPPPDPNALAASVLPWAMAHARRACRPAARDGAVDAAVDAVLWAVANFDPVRGEFGPFARAVVRKSVRWAAVRAAARPDVVPLLDCHPAPPVTPDVAVGLPIAVRELPPDLRDAVRFFFVDRLSLAECGLMCGVSHITIRNRLFKAARVLGDDRVPAGVGDGAKRLRRA